MHFSHSPASTSDATASPMDIPSTSSSRSASCAYPSWPRRLSLSSTSSSSSDEQYHNHSFIISDEELELFGPVFDDERSPVSTPRSDASRSPASPCLREPHFVVESGSLMREVVRQEKERRQRKRSASTSSKKSRRGSKGKGMSSIQEVVE
ncbi:hypothetical protein BJ875DRAFT_14092 [Amylocarpus encephaloides]|uniref:Uncharacterized protein n=1 Tax=Amylocarpus encephaloides TaxID=45428 RepID=A0A9P7YRS0_9HELO|nr:hypothetical protein BJ875DRAFT_14092 [Amylocarpus encephaloides]